MIAPVAMMAAMMTMTMSMSMSAVTMPEVAAIDLGRF
jgi:hypothetical protein